MRATHSTGNHLALELRKREQHVERQSPHAGRGVERLRDRDERNQMLVEKLDELGKIGERSGQPVDLVDHDDVDLAGSDLREKLLQGRAVQGGAGKRVVIVAPIDQAPWPAGRNPGSADGAL